MKTTTRKSRAVLSCVAAIVLMMVPATLLAGNRGIVTTGPVRPNPRVIVTSGPVTPLEGGEYIVPRDEFSPVGSSYAVGSYIDELAVSPFVPLVPVVGENNPWGIVTTGPVIVPDLEADTLALLLDGVSHEARDTVAEIVSCFLEEMTTGEASESVLFMDRDEAVAYGMGTIEEANRELFMVLELLVEYDAEMMWVQIQVSDGY